MKKYARRKFKQERMDNEESERELERVKRGKNGRGGWIRTNAWQDQNLLPYRLATPL